MNSLVIVNYIGNFVDLSIKKLSCCFKGTEKNQRVNIKKTVQFNLYGGQLLFGFVLFISYLEMPLTRLSE